MDKLLDTLKDLVGLGFAGVGIAVFLLVFILLMRDKPADPANARLREVFLKWGVGFAIFCGLMSALAPMLSPDRAGGPTRLRLAFSPDFDSEKLALPKIHLPDGTVSKPGEPFAVPPADVTQVLQIGMDDTLREVRNLRNTSAALAQSVDTALEQRDSLAQAAPDGAAAPQARQGLEIQSNHSAALHKNVTAAVRSGDFNKAAALSARLQTSIAQSDAAVDAIANAPAQ